MKRTHVRLLRHYPVKVRPISEEAFSRFPAFLYNAPVAPKTDEIQYTFHQ